MNLNLNQNQKQEQKLQKRKQQPEPQSAQYPTQALKQDWQQFETAALPALQQQEQQAGWNNKTQEKQQKPSVLTAEKLREYPGLAGLKAVEAQQIAESLILFSQLAYELFLSQQPGAANSNNGKESKSNELVAPGNQLKQQPIIKKETPAIASKTRAKLNLSHNL